VRWMTGSSQASPPPTTLGAPWGRGCPLPPQKHGRSCRTSLTLQHHSPGGSSDCDLQLLCRLAQVDPWLGQFGTGATGATTRHDDDDDTTMPERATQRSEGALRRLRRPAVGNTWAGWGSMPAVFPPGMAGHPCPTLRATSLSLQGEPADIGKG
jgi:hypothetical protein